jgi:protein required for attachment to host cells
VIAASPATLGDLRQTLSKGVKAAIGSEVPKDLTGIPDREIADHLGDLTQAKTR